VNYTDYPVEAITIQALEKFAKATLLTPGGQPDVELFDFEGGSGVDISKVTDVAMLVLEK
jgi:hypothetical protein